jgi:hypothetical protein
MEDPNLRLLIKAKLDDGALPNEGIHHVYGKRGSGEFCDACEQIITDLQLLMEGFGSKVGGVRFHLKCFHIWDAERREEGHEASGPA